MQTLSPAVRGTEKLALLHVQTQVTQGGHHPGRTKRGEEHSPPQALQGREGVAEEHRCCGGRALRRSDPTPGVHMPLVCRGPVDVRGITLHEVTHPWCLVIKRLSLVGLT